MSWRQAQSRGLRKGARLGAGGLKVLVPLGRGNFFVTEICSQRMVWGSKTPLGRRVIRGGWRLKP